METPIDIQEENTISSHFIVRICERLGINYDRYNTVMYRFLSTHYYNIGVITHILFIAHYMLFLISIYNIVNLYALILITIYISTNMVNIISCIIIHYYNNAIYTIFVIIICCIMLFYTWFDNKNLYISCKDSIGCDKVFIIHVNILFIGYPIFTILFAITRFLSL